MARLSRRRTAIVGALAAVIGAAVLIPVFVLGDGSPKLARNLSRGAPQRLPPNSVGVIDPATNSVVGRIPVGGKPLDIVFAEGSVWVANVDDTTVTQIDARTRHVVETIDVGAAPMGLAAGEGAVWVTNGLDGTLTRIDTATGAVGETIRLRPKLRIKLFKNIATHIEGTAWMPVVAAHGSVWVSDVLSSRILRVDARREGIVRALEGYDGISLAAAGDELWLIDYQFRKLVRLDPESSRASLKVQLDPETAPKALAADADSIWVANSGPSAGLPPNFVWRLDAATGAITRKVTVGYLPDAIAVGPTSVWVASWGDHSVTRIDKATGRVAATIQLSRNIGGAAVGAGAVWVTAQ